MDFDEYVSQQGQTLVRLAFVLTRDEQRAEDLTQTALVEAYRHWGRVSAASDPNAYVRRMLVNAHLDWHRRRSSAEQPTDLATRDAVSDADPADAVANRDEVRRALATLAPRARTALVLRYYADLDDAAIADAMGITPSGARATVSRALATLRASRTPSRTLKEAP